MSRQIGPVEGYDVCTNCLVPIAPGEHFCHRCASPLTSHAATDPMGQIYAQGAMYRKAIAHPRKFIVVLGIWLVCGPLCIGTSIAAVAMFVRWINPAPPAPWPFEEETRSYLLDFIMIAPFALAFGVILVRVTWNYLFSFDIQLAESGGDDEKDDEQSVHTLDSATSET